jgi:hypothetical protein
MVRKFTSADTTTRTADEALQVGTPSLRFFSAHDQTSNLFQRRRDHVTAVQYRTAMARAFAVWADISRNAVKALALLRYCPWIAYMATSAPGS